METDDKASSSPAGKAADSVSSSTWCFFMAVQRSCPFYITVLVTQMNGPSLPLLAQKDEPKDQNAKMIKILSGEMAIEFHLQFLIRNNNTDLMILKNTKVKDAIMSIKQAMYCM